MREKPSNIGTALQNAMRGIEAAHQKHLYGVFGDSQWTNKERLPDHTLKDLLEHFSALKLGNAHVNTDIIDNGYEFLIKKFADDSGHTAQEFYTNRIVVHLMAQMLEPKPGEKIYDPTCGTGGMLISALDEVKRKGGEYRTLKLYGQERNHMTASIARMIWRCTAWTISPSPAETRLNIPPSPTKTVSPHLTWCWRTRPIPSVIG